MELYDIGHSAIPCKGQPQTQKLKWKKLVLVSYIS